MTCPACLIALMGTDVPTRADPWYDKILWCQAPGKCVRGKHVAIGAGVIAAALLVNRYWV